MLFRFCCHHRFLEQVNFRSYWMDLEQVPVFGARVAFEHYVFGVRGKASELLRFWAHFCTHKRAKFSFDKIFVAAFVKVYNLS